VHFDFDSLTHTFTNNYVTSKLSETVPVSGLMKNNIFFKDRETMEW
jgi:hypothetical protein